MDEEIQLTDMKMLGVIHEILNVLDLIITEIDNEDKIHLYKYASEKIVNIIMSSADVSPNDHKKLFKINCIIWKLFANIFADLRLCNVLILRQQIIDVDVADVIPTLLDFLKKNTKRFKNEIWKEIICKCEKNFNKIEVEYILISMFNVSDVTERILILKTLISYDDSILKKMCTFGYLPTIFSDRVKVLKQKLNLN